MFADNTAASVRSTAVRDLHDALKGKILLPGDLGYTQARQIWNGAVDRLPAAFARCETREDVQAAVATARAHGVPLSVRGGGYDWAGRSLRRDGFVIDLSAMRHVSVDPAEQIATVGGGATAADVTSAAAPHGLVAVTGTNGAIGMVGLTLAGGYGPLSGRYGLALDNLLSAEIVLASGQIVTASATENSELFWALRGGGGNFGVVTSMRVRLHAPRSLLSGAIVFPWSQAEFVLRGYAQTMGWAPDELTVLAGVLPGSDGNPLVFLAPTWCGEPNHGEQVMAGLQSLGTPVFSQIGPVSYGTMLKMFDGYMVHGRHYAVQTRWLPELTSEAIPAIVAAGTARTSPLSMIYWQHFHGAAARVADGATAFGLRLEHFSVEIVAAWDPGTDGDAHRIWARSLSESLAPYALPGGYPCLLGPAERDQVAFAYGGNAARLGEVKQQFDPDDIFSSAVALPPRESQFASDIW